MSSESAALEHLEHKTWFHCNCGRIAAEDMLTALGESSFLVRQSANHTGYTLSAHIDGEVKHYLIDYNGFAFNLKGKPKTFPSLQGLIDHYVKNQISPSGKKLGLVCKNLAFQEEQPTYVELVSTGKVNQEALAEVASLSTARKAKLSREDSSASSTSLLSPKSEEPSPTRPTSERRKTGSVSSPSSPTDELIPTSSVEIRARIVEVERQLEIERRIYEAARRMADMPEGNKERKKERHLSHEESRDSLFRLENTLDRLTLALSHAARD